MKVCVLANIPFTKTKSDFQIPEFGIVISGKVIYGIIEVDIIVIVAIHKGANIKRAAHAENMADQIGVSECKINCVKSPKAGAGNGHLIQAVFVTQSVYNFMYDKFVVDQMIFDSISGVYALIVPTVLVNAIYTKDLHLSFIDQMVGRMYEFKILTLKISPHSCGEDNNRGSVVAVDKHFKIAA